MRRPAPTAFLLACLCVSAAAGRAAEQARFIERSELLGIDFVHDNFGTDEKYTHEGMGSGVAVLDVDGDGRLDLYFMQSAPMGTEAGPLTNRLFVQLPDGRFEDRTEVAGVGDRRIGFGVAFADVDRDDDLDLYLTNFGPNVLYRNRGDGSFEDVTEDAGVGLALWNSSAGFFDAENDGDLDLYVVSYVDFSLENHRFCGNARMGIRAYCHPDVYDALPDVLYLNDGQGRFAEAGPEAGVPHTPEGKGLGIGFSDLDGDSNIDIYVANDSTMNYLLLGDGQGHFTESALFSGSGYNGAGGAEAGMGVEIGDLDGDGLPEIFVAHLDAETNTLYKNLGGGLFEDATEAAGLGDASLPYVAFGLVFLDHDNDGDLDIFVGNGHMVDNIEMIHDTRTYRQPSQLFDNLGDGRFVEISDRLGLDERLVVRGAVKGDLDRDGDLDLVLAQNDGPARVLLNRHGTSSRSLAVRLHGTDSNPHGFGARLELSVGGVRQVREMRSSSSYESQGPPEVYFGLGAAGQAERLDIRWPSGRVDRHAPLAAGFLYDLTEGSEDAEATAFGPPSP